MLVALVSGLSFGLDDVNPLHAQLLVDYLTGNLGGPQVLSMIYLTRISVIDGC